MFTQKNKAAAGKIDMTNGAIIPLIISFALPLCAGSVLQQLYGTIDTLIIGNFCSADSLAAVGTATQPLEIFTCLFMGVGTGISILVSQYTGTGDIGSLKKLVNTSAAFLYMFTIPASVIGVFLGPAILKIMQVPDSVMPYAVSYLQIVSLGMLGSMGYNLNAGILRGIGDSRSTLYFLIISCFTNIVLDLLFIAMFKMDVSGAALATTISILISWLLSISYIKKTYPELEFTYLPHTMSKEMIANIIRIGVPLGINNSFFSAGHIALQTLINAQGATFMAACSVASKLTSISNVAITSFASASSTFAGQNLGAGKLNRLKQGSWQISLLSGIITASAGILVVIFASPLLSLFTEDTAVLGMALTYVRIYLPWFWTYAVLSVIISLSNGIGNVRYSLIVNILMLWLVRIPCAYLIHILGGGEYIIACYPISFTFGMLAMFLFFRTKTWRQLFVDTQKVNTPAVS